MAVAHQGSWSPETDAQDERADLYNRLQGIRIAALGGFAAKTRRGWHLRRSQPVERGSIPRGWRVDGVENGTARLTRAEYDDHQDKMSITLGRLAATKELPEQDYVDVTYVLTRPNSSDHSTNTMRFAISSDGDPLWAEWQERPTQISGVTNHPFDITKSQEVTDLRGLIEGTHTE